MNIATGRHESTESDKTQVFLKIIQTISNRYIDGVEIIIGNTIRRQDVDNIAEGADDDLSFYKEIVELVSKGVEIGSITICFQFNGKDGSSLPNLFYGRVLFYLIKEISVFLLYPLYVLPSFRFVKNIHRSTGSSAGKGVGGK